MRMFLISDNTDSQMGFRLAGVEGVVVNDKEALINQLDTCLQDESIGIILITTVLFDMHREALLEMKLTLKRPLIVEVSDRHKSHEVQAMLDETIAKIVGKVV